MRDFDLNPLDVIILNGSIKHPLSWPVMWRSLSKQSHCMLIKDMYGNLYDPDIGGILNRNLFEYKGYKDRYVSISRLISLKDDDINDILSWCDEKQKKAKDYDYISWLGFATGLRRIQDENKWYCSEFPYFAFTEHNYKLSNKKISFPFPSLFVENSNFGIIWEGYL